MRKLLVLASALALTLPIAACGGDNTPSAADDTDRPLSGSPSGTPIGLESARDKTEVAILATVIANAGTPGALVVGSPAAAGTNAPRTTTAGTAPASTPGTPETPATSAPGSSVAASTATPAASGTPLATSTAARSSTAGLQLTSASGNRNQEVEVVLSASAAGGNTLRGWIIDVEYDPAFAEAASCTVTGFAVCNEKYRPQLVRFVGTADTAVSEIGRAKFKLVGPTGGSSTLRIIATECIDGAGGPVSCTASEATLRIN